MEDYKLEELMHEKYLPFSEKIFKKHFAPVKRKNVCNSKGNHLDYYKKSIVNYNKYFLNKGNMPLKDEDEKKFRQIEKDERFWIASSMMNLFYSKNRVEAFTTLFKKAYGEEPPIKDIKSWKECFECESNELSLFFEANLTSPLSYKKWLKENIKERQFIPYIIDLAKKKWRIQRQS